MGTGIVEAVERAPDHDRGGGESENAQRIDQYGEHRELHLSRLDLLAEIFRRPPDHETGDEHCNDDHDQEAIQSGADAAGRNAAEQHVEQRHETGQRQE